MVASECAAVKPKPGPPRRPGAGTDNEARDAGTTGAVSGKVVAMFGVTMTGALGMMGTGARICCGIAIPGGGMLAGSTAADVTEAASAGATDGAMDCRAGRAAGSTAEAPSCELSFVIPRTAFEATASIAWILAVAAAAATAAAVGM